MPYAPTAALVLALAFADPSPSPHGPQSLPPQPAVPAGPAAGLHASPSTTRPAPRPLLGPALRLAQQQGYTCSTPQGACSLSYPAPVGSGCSCPIGGQPVSGTVQP
ncbi:MAG: hypothetical protein AAF192_02750 [Pseudomonadota bacterium]